MLKSIDGSGSGDGNGPKDPTGPSDPLDPLKRSLDQMANDLVKMVNDLSKTAREQGVREISVPGIKLVMGGAEILGPDRVEKLKEQRRRLREALVQVKVDHINKSIRLPQSTHALVENTLSMTEPEP